MKPRILFVDDEPNIRLTLPAILKMHEFDVTVAATVPEALKLISHEPFDVLLSDLNIGEPGDGFTVVSAMRRIQPTAATLILTGYPAFESALKAIQSQVDDYLVKPADIPFLVGKIRERLANPVLRQEAPLLKLVELISVNREQILQDWLASTALGEGHGTRESFAEVLDSIIRSLQPSFDRHPGPELASVAAHSERRRIEGCRASSLVDELHALENVILRYAERNLMRVDLSTLFHDLREMNEVFRALLSEAVRAYLAEPEPEEPAVC
ncbi:MAG TPA: response regulator [Terriglobales bacterium]|nr:response regulator [Terriglobales bacterium]